jgi:hypothetical protein
MEEKNIEAPVCKDQSTVKELASPNSTMILLDLKHHQPAYIASPDSTCDCLRNGNR